MKDDNGFSLDVFYFYELNNSKIQINDLKHNIYLTAINEKYRCGVIGLNPLSNTNFRINNIHINIFEELKEKELISENAYTILYEHNY